jgi:hypothetical protein
LTPNVSLQHTYHHPHADQNSFQRSCKCEGLVRDISKMHTCSLTHAMKRGVVLSAIWQEKPRDILPPTDVISLHVLGAAAETMLWALQTSGVGALPFHTAPPASER